jgi:excisionase family DNA binding protein
VACNGLFCAVMTKAHSNSSKLLSSDEVAERLGISIRTLELMRGRGEIKFVPMGPRLIRFRPEAVEEFIASNETRSGGQTRRKAK